MALQIIHEHSFDDLNLETLTDIHLFGSERQFTKDYAVISTLAVTDREVHSAMANERSKNILPLMGMFAIMEQLGEAYKRNDITEYPKDKDSSLKKALYYFNAQDADNDFTKTLYALRNGIVHNASFYSDGRGKSQPHFNFTYSYDNSNIITPASKAWDGDFNNITADSFTEINPKELLKLVESCIQEVSRFSSEGKLEIALAGGKNELIFRYFKWLKLPNKK